MTDADASMDKPPKPAEKASLVPPRHVPPGVVDIGRWPPNKRYAIAAPFAVIGFTNLEFPIIRRARAAGWLEPAEGYGSVRRVFGLYRLARQNRELLRQFVRERDALALTVQDGGLLPLAARVELDQRMEQWPDRDSRLDSGRSLLECPGFRTALNMNRQMGNECAY